MIALTGIIINTLKEMPVGEEIRHEQGETLFCIYKDKEDSFSYEKHESFHLFHIESDLSAEEAVNAFMSR